MSSTRIVSKCDWSGGHDLVERGSDASVSFIKLQYNDKHTTTRIRHLGEFLRLPYHNVDWHEEDMYPFDGLIINPSCDML